MKVARLNAEPEALSDPRFDGWQTLTATSLPLVPTPLKGNPGIKRISPFIEKSTDHGRVDRLAVTCAHNGSNLAVLLRWPSAKHATMADLDQFVDGAAVMFPLTAKASAITMGSAADPVNAWYWKANLDGAAFDVVARGYGTSARHRDPGRPIAAKAHHADDHWHLVLCRELGGPDGRVAFAAGRETRMAFAVWDGGNRERSGRKSFSGDFMPVPIDA